MAAVSVQDSVTFTDTSTENIRYAKEFWKSIDGNFDEKSSLFVPGVDHRLHTASRNIKRSKFQGILLYTLTMAIKSSTSIQ